MNSIELENPCYPEQASSDDIERFVRQIHGHDEDFVDGDISSRLRKFVTYVLRDLQVSEIDPDEFEVHRPTAKIYAARLRRGERAPPIVYDAEDGSIIDGLHRVNGAVKADARSILAYVGLPKHRRPSWIAEG